MSDREADAAPATRRPPPPLPSPARADLGRRAVAALLDASIAWLLALAVPGIGGLAGAAYLLFRDGLEFDFMDHRSVGKQLLKLRLAREDGGPIDLWVSVRRNWTISLAPLTMTLSVLPLIGLLLAPVVMAAALLLGAVELLVLLTDDRGRRLGDRLAGTLLLEE